MWSEHQNRVVRAPKCATQTYPNTNKVEDYSLPMSDLPFDTCSVPRSLVSSDPFIALQSWRFTMELSSSPVLVAAFVVVTH